ncbi:MAG: threonylcarbamoyl-AMP synthase [Clostridia bacterium]|nr:threonylcarbamoyl-AMP synthase [Clostridia bacterium]
METIFGKATEENLNRAARILRDGGLVAFPTETVYGLGGNALLAGAAEAIYAAKGRPSDNPLIIHLSEPEDAERYAVTNALYYRLADAFMPGPITVILPKRDCIPYSVTGGLDTVAVRVPVHPVAHALIGKAGVPVAAPSANLSGRPSPTTADHVREDLYGRVDMIIDGGPCDIGVESTIVRIDGEDALTLCRPGAVTVEDLRGICSSVTLDKAVTEKLGEGDRPVAPGMKYRHYAPASPVVLIDGEHGAAIAYIKEHLTPEVGVICYDEDEDKLSGAGMIRSVGEIADTEAHAHALFDVLREFDSHPEIKKIYSFLPEKDGISLAVHNRFIKAAGFNIIEVRN